MLQADIVATVKAVVEGNEHRKDPSHGGEDLVRDDGARGMRVPLRERIDYFEAKRLWLADESVA